MPVFPLYLALYDDCTDSTLREGERLPPVKFVVTNLLVAEIKEKVVRRYVYLFIHGFEAILHVV